MAAPKPITLTQVASSTGPAPQPMVVVGGVPVGEADLLTVLESVDGYDVEETQTLKHVSGVLTWETDV